MPENNHNDVELPDPGQMLASKFILSSIKQKQIDESQTELAKETPVAKPVEKPTKKDELKELTFDGDKRYFRIGEAGELLGVEPYVLRYWESEFTGIRPMKSRSGHRTYSRSDLQRFCQIRNLLYVEKYSIKGAKKKLSDKRKQDKDRPTVDAREHQKALKETSRQLKELIEWLAQDPGCA